MVEQRWSVIIPVWNGRLFLPDCLDALEPQLDEIHEIIVVDNGSTDGSAELIAAHYPRVRLFCNAHNLGFAQACNIGMRAATGDVLVLLNQDTRVDPDWFSAMQAAVATTDAGVVGCKILSATDRSLQHAGGHVHDVLGIPFHFGKDDPSNVSQWNTPREVEYVTGAAMAVRRQVVERVGLLDENFSPAYYEDVDFCFRVRAAGFKVLYWPAAVLVHHESTSTSEKMRWFYYQRGRIRFILKHWTFKRFVEDFADAEQGLQPTFDRDFGNTRPLRLAYTAARLEASAIAAERWPGDDLKLSQISDVLRRLHAQALAIEFARLQLSQSKPRPAASDLATSNGALDPQALRHAISFPPLEEFQFRSTVPVVGQLFVWIRRAWYGVAARWAVEHFLRQQQVINQGTAEHLRRLSADVERALGVLGARQEALVRLMEDQERHVAAADRFLLENIAHAEEEAIFALTRPPRWDLVLDSATPPKEVL